VRYKGVPIPQTESLKDTIARVLPYWESRIAPELKAGKRVLISAHGNSLRALVKHLSGISDADITGLEIPTGQPIVYQLDDALAATDRYYLSERA
jgi:2,3-bisphosphoglycerate-dependent phosphoglycerate mutase